MSTENNIYNEIIAIGNQLLEELRGIHLTLKDNNRQIRRKSTIAEQVNMLLGEFPRPDWSAVELAEKIGNGCTPNAVRNTAIWKAYRKYQRKEQSSHSRKNFIDDGFIRQIDDRLDNTAQ